MTNNRLALWVMLAVQLGTALALGLALRQISINSRRISTITDQTRHEQLFNEGRMLCTRNEVDALVSGASPSPCPAWVIPSK